MALATAAQWTLSGSRSCWRTVAKATSRLGRTATSVPSGMDGKAGLVIDGDAPDIGHVLHAEEREFLG